MQGFSTPRALDFSMLVSLGEFSVADVTKLKYVAQLFHCFVTILIRVQGVLIDLINSNTGALPQFFVDHLKQLN